MTDQLDPSDREARTETRKIFMIVYTNGLLFVCLFASIQATYERLPFETTSNSTIYRKPGSPQATPETT